MRGLRGDPRAPIGELPGRKPRADHRLERAARLHARGERRLHDAAREQRQRLVARRLLAAPPRMHRGQRQRLVEQGLREARQEAENAGRFEKARARQVREQHVARAHRLHQPRHAEQRIRAQLERIEPFVVDAPQDSMHRFEPAQRLQIDALVARGQVAAFDEREAQVAREVCMLEIGRRMRARRQQHDARVLPRGAQRLHALQQRAIARREPLHVQAAKRARKEPRHDQPVLQQIAEPRRALRVLRHQPPRAVRPAREIERGDVQPRAARRLRAAHRPQIARMPGDERGRQQPAAQDRLFSVEIGEDRIAQAHALQHAPLDRRPVVGRDDERQQVERPGPHRAAARRALVRMIGEPVLAHPALQRVGAAIEIGEADTAELREECAPRGRERRARQRSRAAAQLVVTARDRRRGERRAELGRVLLRTRIE